MSDITETFISDIADKWGKSVAERGFAQLPNYLLLLNQFLDKDTRLSPVELLVLIQLVGTWWKKSEQPFPSMSTLAVRCGVSERQIQRAVNRLVELGLVARVKRRLRGIISSNAYDLGPLVSLLEDIAKIFPNEFPRRVERETLRAISNKLAGSDKRTVQAPAQQPIGRTTPDAAPARPSSPAITEADFATEIPNKPPRAARGRRNITITRKKKT
jgi:predicted transcriptional regulator